MCIWLHMCKPTYCIQKCVQIWKPNVVWPRTVIKRQLPPGIRSFGISVDKKDQRYIHVPTTWYIYYNIYRIIHMSIMKKNVIIFIYYTIQWQFTELKPALSALCWEMRSFKNDQPLECGEMGQTLWHQNAKNIKKNKVYG